MGESGEDKRERGRERERELKDRDLEREEEEHPQFVVQQATPAPEKGRKREGRSLGGWIAAAGVGRNG